MTIRYVRPQGPNKGLKETGASWATAFNTGHEAETKSKPGDIINIAKGTYKGTLTVDVDDLTLNLAPGATFNGRGTAQFNLRILSDGVRVNGGTYINSLHASIIVDGAADTVIDGVTVRDSGGHGLYVVKSDYFTLSNSEIEHNAQMWRAAGISVHIPKAADNAAGYHMKFIGNAIHDNGPMAAALGIPEGWGILFDYDFWRRGGGDYKYPILVQDNEIYGNALAGLYGFHAGRLWIADNKIYDNYAQDNGKIKGGEVMGNDSLGLHLIRNDIDAMDDHFTFKGIGTAGGTVRYHANELSVENSNGNGLYHAAGWKITTTWPNKIVPYVDHTPDFDFAVKADSGHEPGVQAAALHIEDHLL